MTADTASDTHIADLLARQPKDRPLIQDERVVI